jgi:hypothetical protein
MATKPVTQGKAAEKREDMRDMAKSGMSAKAFNKQDRREDMPAAVGRKTPGKGKGNA